MARKPKTQEEEIPQEDDVGLPQPTKDDITLSEFIQTMHEPNYSPVGSEKGLPTVEWLKGQFQTKSACVRYLISRGHAVKDIAKHLNMRYQHVRNVSKNELKRGPNEDWRKPYLEGSNLPDAKSFNPEKS